MNRHIQTKAAIFLALISIFSCRNNYSPGSTFPDAETWVAQVKSEVKMTDTEDLYARMEEGEMFVLIDVRTRSEHDSGYIPGSVWIPRGLIEFRIASPEFWEEEGLYEPLKDELIILYCRSGNRSALAAQSLSRLGYTNVLSVEGGFNAWMEQYKDKIEYNLPQIMPGQQGPVLQEEEGGTC